MSDQKTRSDHMMDDRRAKLAELRERGIDPFPADTHRSHRIAQILEAGNDADASVAGRLIAIREHGKTVFADLADESGQIQLSWKADELTDEVFEQVKLLDPGDLLAVEGKTFTTKMGELTILVRTHQLLAKAIRPIPRSWQEFDNKEERFRKRYLDMQLNPEVTERFRRRSQIIQSLREEFIARNFLEVDTPMLHPIPGGTLAKPFMTHYHAYDTDVYLRVAPELYLKRLLVGGFERVFEYARCFRNEGADPTHNPEFTQIEAYAAYWDYQDIMTCLEEVISAAVERTFGTRTLVLGGQEVSFQPPFDRVTFHELSGGSDDDHAFKLGYKQLIQPTFAIHHPVSHIPLGKTVPDNPALAQSFQLIIKGSECAIGWTELNDPDVQRARFEEQERLRAKGDDEAMRLDTEFLEALEYGMPPAGGLGLGTDRLVTILSDADSIREALLFPYMKPVHPRTQLPRNFSRKDTEGDYA